MTDKTIVKERKSWIDTQTKDRVKMHESKERVCDEVRNSTTSPETRCKERKRKKAVQSPAVVQCKVWNVKDRDTKDPHETAISAPVGKDPQPLTTVQV
jgi:hypothetical protein